MRLTRLTLNNFRQFYGRQEMRFASGDQNITVIHGYNGSGKTAILNAFSWCLFEEHSSGFLDPESLVTRQAVLDAEVGSIVDAEVTVEFRHGAGEYRAKRFLDVKKIQEPDVTERTRQPTLHLVLTQDDGTKRTLEGGEASDAIQKVLPAELHWYFFFDGERIERLVQPDQVQRERIARATKKLLGIEVLDRGIRHLNSVAKTFEKQMAKGAGGKLGQLRDDKTKAERELENLREQLQETNENISAASNQKTEIQERLRQLQSASQLQNERDELDEKHRSTENMRNDAQRRIRQALSKNAYSLFLTDAVSSFGSRMADLRRRGDLPSGIKKRFVDSILETRQCICGNHLAEGSPARQKVEAWRQKAGLDDIEDKAISLDGKAENIRQSLSTFQDLVDQAIEDERRAREDLKSISDRLDQIREQLEGSPDEDVAELEKRAERLDEDLDSYKKKAGDLEGQCKRRQDDIDTYDKKIYEYEGLEKRQKRARSRAFAAKESSRLIEHMRSELVEAFRKDLQSRIQKVFREISTTPYVPSVHEDYSLTLRYTASDDSSVVPASQGENQILSLSFIGSIIGMNRQRTEGRSHIPRPDAGEYPVVMDSPFGSLDPNYREQIASRMPVLADQVILLVSLSQWRGEVEHAVRPRIGREYVLKYYSPKEGATTQDATLECGQITMVAPSDEEYTEIVEVTNG